MARPRASRRNAAAAAEPERSVADHVRERQRRVAEREADRLARPEERPKERLGTSFYASFLYVLRPKPFYIIVDPSLFRLQAMPIAKSLLSRRLHVDC